MKSILDNGGRQFQSANKSETQMLVVDFSRAAVRALKIEKQRTESIYLRSNLQHRAYRKDIERHKRNARKKKKERKGANVSNKSSE